MTGIAPSELMETGDTMLEELWHSYTERESHLWTWERELLATAVELLHTLYRQQAAIWGAKQHQIPPPLHIPRPHDKEIEPEVTTAAGLARMLRSG